MDPAAPNHRGAFFYYQSGSVSDPPDLRAPTIGGLIFEPHPRASRSTAAAVMRNLAIVDVLLEPECWDVFAVFS